MGVEGLSKLVKPVREVKLQEFKGMTFAIDAMVELNRVFKGQVILTNKNGEKTHHIRSLLSVILKLQSFGIKQIWVFDHDVSKDEFPTQHFKYKMQTLVKRRAVKAKNKVKIEAMKLKADEIESKLANMTEEEKVQYDELFEGLDALNLDAVKAEINTIQKRIDSPHNKEINDLKYMLDLLGIEWVEAPCTYEAEAICAELVKNKIANYAFTPDLDSLLYGAPNVIKRSGKGKDVKYYLYNLDDISGELDIGYDDLIKVGLCLGTDANPDGIKGIGIKTVLNKFHNATDWESLPFSELIEMFSRNYDVNKLEFHNIQSVSFTPEQQKLLINWLVDKQNFERDRTVKQFSNALSDFKVGDIINKTPVLDIKWEWNM